MASNVDKFMVASNVDQDHSFNKRCLRCDGDCLHRRYSARLRRFVKAHIEAYTTAYMDGARASANELRRLETEYRTLPPRHDCSCWCRYERCSDTQCGRKRHYHYVCADCQRLRRSSQDVEDVRQQGGVLGPETPMVLLLDYMAGLMAA